MSLITRHHAGSMRFNVALLADVESALAVDNSNRRAVAATARRIRAARAAGNFAEAERLYDLARFKDWNGFALDVLEVDAVQQLRGRLRRYSGYATVDAEAVSNVRNVLAALALDADCDSDEKDNGDCLCHGCQVRLLAERFDAALDREGFNGGPNYEGYAKAAPDIDAEWQRRFDLEWSRYAAPSQLAQEGR